MIFLRIIGGVTASILSGGIFLIIMSLIRDRLSLISSNSVISFYWTIVLIIGIIFIPYIIAKKIIFLPKKQICLLCNNFGRFPKKPRGYFLIEIILWFFFLIPGLIYSIWRHMSAKNACTSCGSTNVILMNSMKAKEILSQKVEIDGTSIKGVGEIKADLINSSGTKTTVFNGALNGLGKLKINHLPKGKYTIEILNKSINTLEKGSLEIS